MPSKSKKQHNLMALVANDPKAAKRLGIPKSVGEEFMKADKGKKFGKGGYAAGGCASKADAKKIAKKEVAGHEKSMHKMKKGGSITEKGTGEKYASKTAMMRHEKKESKAEEMKEHGIKGYGMKKGGKVKKYAEGGAVASGKKPAESDYDKKLREEALQSMRDKKMMEQSGKAYEKAKEQSLGAPEKKMRSGGSCGMKKYARGGGIEVRGKTKGKMV